jgi:Fe-S cluster assembly ATP-binding protein
MKLEIKDLHVSIEGKEILHGVTLTIHKGEVHALMGPNGSGKSTLANTMMGHPKYEITKGTIILDGEDITELDPDKRAQLGLFLSFQYPQEIDGVTLSNFLKTAYNATHPDAPLEMLKFHNYLKEKMADLKMDLAFARRYLNKGFSGGEKKRAEILQMSILQPSYVLLDETDSGLDVDALKIVAEGVNKLKSPERGFLLITHYHRILHYIQPDFVHIIKDGHLVRTGKADLAKRIEDEGFDPILAEVAK